jgi:hypothetical protein
MSDKTQTAVSWLEEQAENNDMGNLPIWIYHLFLKAKEMEKQQMINAFDEGVESDYYSQFENYYNKTYKS